MNVLDPGDSVMLVVVFVVRQVRKVQSMFDFRACFFFFRFVVLEGIGSFTPFLLYLVIIKILILPISYCTCTLRPQNQQWIAFACPSHRLVRSSTCIWFVQHHQSKCFEWPPCCPLDQKKYQKKEKYFIEDTSLLEVYD